MTSSFSTPRKSRHLKPLARPGRPVEKLRQTTAYTQARVEEATAGERTFPVRFVATGTSEVGPHKNRIDQVAFDEATQAAIRQMTPRAYMPEADSEETAPERPASVTQHASSGDPAEAPAATAKLDRSA
ncbi:MAG: hypothetical protein R2857_05075 [Vampirovibrionales bacterium]